ncbi:MAG: effector binding domain-containing protein [Streptococcus sp.]|nr:effector binding domain-containing protein [Streptococcus sp.]
MKFSIIDSKRTNNFSDPKIETKIMSLWKDNFSEIDIIKNEKLSIASVYHDYESNYKGDYTVSICKEDNLKGNFDTERYKWKEYKVDNDDEMGIYNTWKKIWSDEENNIIERVYDFDFEHYKSNGEISIFVAIL